MLTLGIHDGHTATACLFEDGQVIACISEDRLNRQKEWAGFPRLAIAKCLEITDKSPGDIDAVGICSLMPQIGHDGYHSPALHKRIFGWATHLLPRAVLQSPANVRRLHRLAPALFAGRLSRLRQQLRKAGVTTSNVRCYDHHLLHAATAYYTSWYKDRKTLVITLDGSGDGICATVNVAENGKIERLAEVFNYNSVCELYTRVTQHLGMKPMSHEYKVMGMAPYVPQRYRDEILRDIRGYFELRPDRPLEFFNTSGAWKWQLQNRLRRDLQGRRFDTISGAAQQLFEEVVVQWVRNVIRETGISDLALSGGGFMNVKVNYLISQLPEVDSLFIFPSCGDESNPVGASILAAIDSGLSHEAVDSLGMIYWGPEYDQDDIEAAVHSGLRDAPDIHVEQVDDINGVIAKRLAAGQIVGRFTGRMEWGARALGNRSILADPRHQQVTHKLNKAIKMRDFWMPFAPAILTEYRERYLELREDFPCPYMTIAPETRPEAWDAIPAGLHPFDKSARAQILDPENHPDFHDLISRFAELTGVGGVLNTSFNLHGDPIVCTPEDAIATFLNSGLDVLQLGKYLIEKLDASTPHHAREAVLVSADSTATSDAKRALDFSPKPR